MLACGGREAMVMAPSPTCDLAVSPCFHGCPAFLHRHFPPQSPPSHPLCQSLRSQQQPSPWDCPTIPKLELLAAALSRGSIPGNIYPWFSEKINKIDKPLVRRTRWRSRWMGYLSLSGVFMAAARTVWFSFHLGCHRSAVSHSALNVSPLTQTIAPMWDQTFASVPPPTEGRSSPANTPGLPPSSFILLSFAWVYIFFSSADRYSQLVFCMHFCVWRCIPDVAMERDVLHVHLLLCRLVLLTKCLSILFIFSENQLLISLASFCCCCFLDFYFIYFCSHLYDLFPSTHFGFFFPPHFGFCLFFWI